MKHYSVILYNKRMRAYIYPSVLANSEDEAARKALELVGGVPEDNIVERVAEIKPK